MFDAEENAAENNEARYQLVEGCYYDYQISDSEFVLGDVGENIIQQHKRTANLGTIAPNIFVGTLSIPLLDRQTSQELCKIGLEVQSVKSGYRNDYRDMLELITEKCTDLLLQANSPVSQHFGIDYTKDSQTLYQKFVFIKSVIGSDDFSEAIHRIVTAPVTKWMETTEKKDIRNIRRFSNANIKEIIKNGRRIKLPESNYLRSYGIDTLAERITTIRKTDSVDTPENRFIKHALENFLKFCTDINNKAKEFGHKKMEIESGVMIRELESQLHHTVFKAILRPTSLKLNSPVLQRKEGYREVLRVWLMFDLAAKLIWKGGDDIYSGGKKDIATLYEYWLFFKLLDLFQSIFEIEPKDISDLIQETPDGLNLQIKQGKFTPLRGVYNSGSRKLNILFNYNRSFSGKKQYPDSGSWTTTLRPDYTLSFWPVGISEAEAEKQELIVHVHFDAKYKIANLKDFLSEKSSNELDEEKKEHRKGIYKNVDLLKMHAYKDAIRRTGGAYILYPGEIPLIKTGFHEIIPGLGAFPVRPAKTDDGIHELKDFILEVVNHFLNRASQREKIAYRAYDIYKNKPKKEDEINDPLPETYGENRNLIPDETYVLVGYCKSDTHYEWYRNHGLYNFRMNDETGSLILDEKTVKAKYLLLRRNGKADDVFRIISKGPKVFVNKKLSEKGYPNPSESEYLVIEIEKENTLELGQSGWNFKELEPYQKLVNLEKNPYKLAGIPFTVSLTELMKVKIR
ncbi:MAG TPA: DUF2357 domain-containing protein [Saprospiraceae bacterium]|nr:DUF2357 domain-containing protein [Saprospiraceae bacterium]